MFEILWVCRECAWKEPMGDDGATATTEVRSLHRHFRDHEFITYLCRTQTLFFCSSTVKMRVYSRLLATATDAGASRGFRQAPSALLPPIPLYRTILRTHRKRLGVEERVLGDMYVKAEFRAHKSIDNPVQIVSKPQQQPHLPPNESRLDFYQNGNNTLKLSKATLGKVRKWRRAKLTK